MGREVHGQRCVHETRMVVRDGCHVDAAGMRSNGTENGRRDRGLGGENDRPEDQEVQNRPGGEGRNQDPSMLRETRMHEGMPIFAGSNDISREAQRQDHGLPLLNSGKGKERQSSHGEVLGQAFGRGPHRPLSETFGCHVLHQKRHGRAGHFFLGSVEKLSCLPIHGGGLARKANEREVEGHDGGGGKALGGEPHTVPREMDGGIGGEQVELTGNTSCEISVPSGPRQGERGKVRRGTSTTNPSTWATSQTRGKKKVTHLVTKAALQTDLNEWSTACGWHFAQREVKVTLSKIPPVSAHRCIKCEKVKELRDKVPGGAGLAQLMSNELDVMLQK